MSEIKYRRYESGDRDSVLALFEAAFGKGKNSDQWDWEFFGGPRPGMIVVAESDRRIVGYYAVLPRKIKAGQKVIESGLVVDVMTHPDFGRRGIFVNSGLEAIRQAEEAGLQMLIGFPNEAAIRGHLKVGWSELGSVRLHVRPLKAEAFVMAAGDRIMLPGLAKRMFGLAFSVANKISLGQSARDMHIEWTTAAGLDAIRNEFETLANGVQESNLVCNVRSMEWMKWRLSDPLGVTLALLIRDRKSMTLVGFGLLKVKEWEGIRVGAVMDLIAKDNSAVILEAISREILRRSLEERCELMVLMGSPAFDQRRVFRRMFFMPTPRKLRFIVRSVKEGGLPDEVYELHNWHLELIDHDVF